MGTIILLDLTSLNYINPYLSIFNSYPYFINDFTIYSRDYCLLLSRGSPDILDLWDILSFNNIIYINLCKFFINFNTIEISFNFLCIYLFILIISIITKIRLYWELKSFIHSFFLFVRTFKFKNLLIYINYFYWNLLYLILFWIRKKTWNRLNFRSLELRNKKNPKYHQLQYIKFFYVKFMFDIFFSIILRLFLFLFLFFFRSLFFLIYSILSLFFLKSDIYLIFTYFSMYRDLFIKKIISLTFLDKIYSLIYYLKIELFIYFFNDRNFLGGLIYYIYNTIYYKIGIFYNYNNWENVEFRTSSYLSNYYNKIKPLFDNYKISFFLFKINLNYLYIFFYIPIYMFYLIINSLAFIAQYFNSMISYYDIIELKYFSYIQWRIIFLAGFSFYAAINLNYLDTLSYLLIILIINYIYFLIPRHLIYISRLNIFFYYLGFSVIYFFDFLKAIIYYFYWIFIHLFFKLKYILLIVILYKLGIFYLLNLGFLNFISNYFEVTLFFILDKILYVFLDYYNLKNYYSYTTEFNLQLINIISFDFTMARDDFNTYLHNSFLNRIYTLNFKSIDLSRLSWSAFIEYQRSATRHITARKYYFNLFLEFTRETLTFFLICKNYFLLKFLKFYYIYIMRYSEFNLYYYFFKKIYTFIYLLYIYLYFYLKWLYYYFVPLYIMPRFIILNISIIYSLFYLFFYKFYFICYNIYKIFINIFFLNLLRFIYLLTLLKVYFFNLMTFFYYIIYDLIYLFTAQKIFIFYSNNLVEWYLDYLVNKSLFRENLKDLFINYFRIPKKNLINWNLDRSLILGGKLRAVCLLDVDSLNMKQVKEAGLMVHQLEDFLVVSKPEVKHNRIFKNRDNLLIFSDIFLLFQIFYPDEHWLSFYMREQWIINFFLRKLIMYYLIDLYFIYYMFFCLLFFYFFRDRGKLLNIDQMWKNLKDEFDFKLLNNNNLFIKALNFYQKNMGKKRRINYLFKVLNNHWKNISHNLLKNKRKNYLINKRIYKFISKNIFLAKLNSFVTINSKLKNIHLEKNLYYNNKFFFYWKNFIFFDKDKNFYEKYDKNNQFLYFFLSLIFKRNRYSSLIFFYFDTLNKMYFYNNGLPRYLNKTYDLSRSYFQKLDDLLFRGKGYDWLLHKDLSLILYKDESLDSSEMYSLNFNIIIPYFEKFFFWFIIVIYLYFTKFHWRLTPQVDFLGRINRMIYLQSLIINDNFLYFYNLSIYWINAYFMFDIKHFSYEYNDFVTEWRKNRKYFKHIRKSASFLINNDPLFFHKKSNAYHLLWLNNKYDWVYTSFSINLFYIIRKVIIMVVILIFYIKIVIRKKGYIYSLLNNCLDILWYLFYFYNRNIINTNSYLNFYYKKILSNLEMKLFINNEKKK